eukprot:scaffold173285_cov38-Prasinocladus_malaysianus.AAC.1
MTARFVLVLVLVCNGRTTRTCTRTRASRCYGTSTTTKKPATGNDENASSFRNKCADTSERLIALRSKSRELLVRLFLVRVAPLDEAMTPLHAS